MTELKSRSTSRTTYLISLLRPQTGVTLSFNSNYLSAFISILCMFNGLIKCTYVVTLQQMNMPGASPCLLQVSLSIATSSSLFTGAMDTLKLVLYLYSLFCSFYDTNSLPQSILTGITDLRKVVNLCPCLTSVNLKSTPSWNV